MKLSLAAVQSCEWRCLTSWVSLFLLGSVLCLWTNVDGWSYHWSNHTMEWKEARKWCTERYTDMVAIQNQEEIIHLNKSIPKRENYYWIGIRKVNDVWTWVGTGKALTAEASNWAKGEPNNGKDGSKKQISEDCVEIYIKRSEQAGKWNDEGCFKKKAALCYSASCREDSCDNGECIETINNHTCKCHPGFYGTRCQHAVQCPALQDQKNGTVSCEEETDLRFSFKGTCSFSCEPGFQLTGSSEVTCTSAGVWSDKIPQCLEIKCPVPEGDAQLITECSKRLTNLVPNSTCSFSCEPGYRLTGSNEVTCTSAGVWSDKIPQCVEIKCPVPEGDAQLITECSKRLTNLGPNSTCRFSCEPGYRLTGSNEVTCTSAGVWSDKIPQCLEIKCPVPEGDAQLITECSKRLTNLVPNSTCSFSCEPGYRLTGSNEVTCTSAGVWSDKIPQCVEIKCPVPEGNAQLITECSKRLTNLGPNSTCSFSCEPGYRLTGSNEVTCTSAGVWSDEVPQCVEIKCPVPEGDAQLITECSKRLTNLVPNSTCSFSCEPGYRLTGSNEVTCTSAGVWSDEIPQCVEITCPVPEGDAQLITECSKRLTNLVPNSTCSFSCEPGFELQGTAHRKCSENGQWSGVTPTCKAVRCPLPDAPKNGHINCSDSRPFFSSQCFITCHEGFMLDGHELLICSRHGNWTGKTPTCQAPSYRLSAITTGVTVGGAAAVSGLSLAMWLFKRIKRKASTFELNSNSDIDEPPQVYKNSIDSLI